MLPQIVLLAAAAFQTQQPQFELATIKPTSPKRFVATNFSLRELIAAVCKVNPRSVLREQSEPAKPGFFTAIQQQIGLKLEASKGPVLALIIDRIQRPTGN